MDGTPIAGLPNLGPKSAAMLARAGIRTVGQLRRLGAVPAFARVRASGADASLNLLWALEGAIAGLHWRDVARLHRTSLLLALDDLQRQANAWPAAAKRRRPARSRNGITPSSEA